MKRTLAPSPRTVQVSEDKQAIVEFNTQDSNDPATEMKFIGDRKIKIAPDGKSAIMVIQAMTDWSPKIPIRFVFHFDHRHDSPQVHAGGFS